MWTGNTDRVRVFVTNDDGGRAPGLTALVGAVAAAYADTVVAAPEVECGDYGTSLRRDSAWIRSLLDLARPERPGPGELPATPALLVKAACAGVFGPAPDVVVAGVNYGPNVGCGVLHSGTVGAVLTAVNMGVPALAISLDDVYSTGGREDGRMYWQTASAVAVPLIDWLGRVSPGAAALNVNVPNREPAMVSGVRVARLAGPGSDLDTGRRWPDDDMALLAAGYLTISALAGIDGGTVDARAAARWLAARVRIG